MGTKSQNTTLHRAMLLMNNERNDFIVAPVGSNIVMNPPEGYDYSTGACWADYAEEDEDWQYLWWCIEVLSNPSWNGGLQHDREASRAIFIKLRNELEEHIVDLPRPFPRYPDELCDATLFGYINRIVQCQRETVSSNESFNAGHTEISWAIETSKFWEARHKRREDLFWFQYPFYRQIIDKYDATGPGLSWHSIKGKSLNNLWSGKIEQWANMANAVPMMLNTIKAQEARIKELEELAMSAEARKDS